jgi:hypothetical protein
MLKTYKGEYLCVEYRDLEQFILEETGHEYEVLPNEEYGNDSVHRFQVHADRSTPYWETFKATGEQKPFYLDAILNGLCADGKIEPGGYLVCVCW